MPSRPERAEGHSCSGAIGWLPLLFVVHRSAGELLALRIGSGEGDRAGLAVCRHDTATGSRNFVALLVGERQRMIVDFLVGPRIRIRAPCDRVAFAVEPARPLAMHRLAGAFGGIPGRLLGDL